MPGQPPGRREERERLKKLTTGILLALLALTLTALPASAGRAWCRADPIFIVDGRLVDVMIAGPPLALLHVTGPTKVTVTVPDGVQATHVLSDLGFGRGYQVVIKSSNELQVTPEGTQIRVEVYVPARTSFPIRVDAGVGLLGVLTPASVEGMANSWVTLHTVV
jgi:hypothetical protein